MQPHVIILGGGPAGCGAAWRLRREDRARVTLLEARQLFGGNAGSFDFGGQRVDFGSHRLHFACEPRILADLRTLLGEDLQSRARHGRIRLRGRWIHFPLRAPDLLLRLDRRFALGAIRDMATRTLRREHDGGDFAAVLRAHLGPTICDSFYFPYAWKIWGRDPTELAAVQARKRVSASSFAKLLRQVLRPRGKGRYYYPREGFGQITEALAGAAERTGCDLRLGHRVTAIHRPKDAASAWQVDCETEEGRISIRGDQVWSTLPLSLAAAVMEPAPPADVLAAAQAIEYRAMVLLYVRLPVKRFRVAETHYFPERDVALTRLSEPRNYRDGDDPQDSTVLCAEIPCSAEDETWRASPAHLAERLATDLARVDLPLPASPEEVAVKRLRHAYPIYSTGYADALAPVDRWLGSLPRFLTYGRQGLFAHDNTHHALAMAYGAVDCLEPNGFRSDRWAELRTLFEQHVVED